jgi:hypothetical protein
MSKTHAADAQDSETAAAETTPADETQRNNPQGEKPAAGADGDDYLAQRNAFLENEEEFLKTNEAADAADEETGKTDDTGDGKAESGEAETTEEKTEADATEDADENADDTDQTDDTTPKRKHVNLSRMGEDKAKLVLFLDKNPDVPLDKAVEILGISLTKQEQQEAAETGLPKTVAEVDDLIKAKRAERKKAFGEDLDFKLAADLDEEIETLRDHAATLQSQEAAARSQETERFTSAFDESKRNAVKYYPDAAKADSPLVKRMLELDEVLKETGDERFNDPDKPFLLAKSAAKDLGILPTSPSSAKKSPPPAPAKVQSPVQPARGNARTQQTNAREGTLDEVVDNIRTEDDYEAAKKLALKV